MEFYITPDKRQECEKKLAQLFKKMERKPTVTYSNVQKVEKKERVIFKDEDGDDYRDYTYTLDAIKVDIDDFILDGDSGDWYMVAGVYHRDNIVTLISSKYFGQIPKQYGLGYLRCDYCGTTHGDRIESHILHNPKTGEWMQVGSTCVNKIFAQGKYLGGLILKLREVFQVKLGGCDEGGWNGGWRPADNYWRMAISLKGALAVCKKFWDGDEENHKWKKSQYTDYGRQKISYGTNDILMDWYGRKDIVHDIDESYYQKVVNYVDGLEGGYDVNYYGDEEPNFNQKIKDAFACGYIQAVEMFLAYFAVKGYEDSLTAPDFDAAIKTNGIVNGEKYTFSGTLDKIEKIEGLDHYGQECWWYDAFLTDTKSGLKFTKVISHTGVIEKYKQVDGTYKFNAVVKWIDRNNRVIKLGGRLSKSK